MGRMKRNLPLPKYSAALASKKLPSGLDAYNGGIHAFHVVTHGNTFPHRGHKRVHFRVKTTRFTLCGLRRRRRCCCCSSIFLFSLPNPILRQNGLDALLRSLTHSPNVNA